MRAAIKSQQGQAASGKAEEEPILVCIAGDGNAAGRRLGAGPRRQRSAGHALVFAAPPTTAESLQAPDRAEVTDRGAGVFVSVT